MFNTVVKYLLLEESNSSVDSNNTLVTKPSFLEFIRESKGSHIAVKEKTPIGQDVLEFINSDEFPKTYLNYKKIAKGMRETIRGVGNDLSARNKRIVANSDAIARLVPDKFIRTKMLRPESKLSKGDLGILRGVVDSELNIYSGKLLENENAVRGKKIDLNPMIGALKQAMFDLAERRPSNPEMFELTDEIYIDGESTGRTAAEYIAWYSIKRFIEKFGSNRPISSRREYTGAHAGYGDVNADLYDDENAHENDAPPEDGSNNDYMQNYISGM